MTSDIMGSIRRNIFQRGKKGNLANFEVAKKKEKVSLLSVFKRMWKKEVHPIKLPNSMASLTAGFQHVQTKWYNQTHKKKSTRQKKKRKKEKKTLLSHSKVQKEREPKLVLYYGRFNGQRSIHVLSIILPSQMRKTILFLEMRQKG